MLVYYFAIIYTGLISFILDVTRNTKRSRHIRKILLLSIIIVLTLIAAFRWRVGTDYMAYEYLYNQYKNYRINISTFIFDEPGIRLISIMVKKIKDDPTIMMAVSSVITLTFMLGAITKNSNSLFLTFLLFIFTGVWHGTFNGIRQYLACAILMFSHKYIISREFYKYFIMVFVASLFHFSAWAMIFLYIVPQEKLMKKDYTIIIFTSLLIYILNPFIYNFIGSYLNKFDGEFVVKKVNMVRVLVGFAPIIIYYLFTDEKKLTKKDYFYINVVIINAIIFLGTYRSIYLTRILIYLSCYSCLGIDSMLKTMDSRIKYILIMIILLLYFVFWYIDISQQSTIIIYKNIFTKNMN